MTKCSPVFWMLGLCLCAACDNEGSHSNSSVDSESESAIGTDSDTQSGSATTIEKDSETANDTGSQEVTDTPVGTDTQEGEHVVVATTLTDKIMAGYQGWFNAEGDGAGVGWRHWSRQTPDADNLQFEMWPDMRELDEDELYSTQFQYEDGSNAGLYSAFIEKTVVRHVKWMQDYGIDGVFVQRFIGETTDPAFRVVRDKVLNSIRVGSEQYGRVFVNMYDISGGNEETVTEDVKNDWMHLVDNEKITQSPSYLQHNGKPLVAIWGFGFESRPGSPEKVAELIDWFKNSAEEKYQATLMGGVPTRWRELTKDSKTDPAWASIYRSYDVISPWTVGRYRSDLEADNFRTKQTEPDLAECRALGIDYLPVVFPGFSWSNMKPDEFNQIPRRGGRFFWRQVHNAIEAGNDMIYVAMFDEVDEGTAMYKVAENASQTPTTGQFLTLDADGEDLPSDWYLRLMGEASKVLRGDLAVSETLPITP